VAAQAYREAIALPVSATRLPYAKYGYASCLKELGALSDTLSLSSVSGVMPATESQPRYEGPLHTSGKSSRSTRRASSHPSRTIRSASYSLRAFLTWMVRSVNFRAQQPVSRIAARYGLRRT